MHRSIGEMKNDLCRRGKIPAANPTGECEIYMLGYTYIVMHACIDARANHPRVPTFLRVRSISRQARATLEMETYRPVTS